MMVKRWRERVMRECIIPSSIPSITKLVRKSDKKLMLMRKKEPLKMYDSKMVTTYHNKPKSTLSFF